MMLPKPAKSARKSAQHSRTASSRVAHRRPHYLKRVGAVTRRYMAARATFLLARLGGGSCACDLCGKGCKITLQLGRDGAASRIWTEEGFHVHHLAKRSTHPELRETQSNLALLCASCHAKAHATVVS